MAQWNRYNTVEDKYFLPMMEYVKDFFGTNIKYKSCKKTDLDLHHCVDAQVNVNGKIYNLALRSRDDLEHNDLTIRYTASDSGLPSEYHKIINGKCKAHLYCYYRTNGTKENMTIYNMKKIVESGLLEKYKDNRKHNVYESGHPDGSEFVMIPADELMKHNCIMYYNKNYTL